MTGQSQEDPSTAGPLPSAGSWAFSQPCISWLPPFKVYSGLGVEWPNILGLTDCPVGPYLCGKPLSTYRMHASCSFLVPDDEAGGGQEGVTGSGQV